MKYLMSQLYSSPPDVGLLIFDPEGEYALPDTVGRPGLVNVPGLRNRISLYTNRKVEPQYPSKSSGERHQSRSKGYFIELLSAGEFGFSLSPWGERFENFG